jgi:hypothetical protein
MQKRKLQIFLSSTYEDLIDHRLAAMEAILAAGHIPAAMEQFAPGDETAWEKIRAWIDESDAFILILGGRYGSIEPVSGTSYVQLEYEYALKTKKPFFAIVVSKAHHEQRVKEVGLTIDERENQQKYKEFRNLVEKRLCGFWNDKKDIKAAVFQKLPEWAQRSELVGWVRGDEAANPEVMNELARLSHENRELRAASVNAETFVGLSLESLVEALQEHKASSEDIENLRRSRSITFEGAGPSILEVFLAVFEPLSMNRLYAEELNVFGKLASFGLVERRDNRIFVTDAGRRLRNRLLVQGRSAAADRDPG